MLILNVCYTHNLVNNLEKPIYIIHRGMNYFSKILIWFKICHQ